MRFVIFGAGAIGGVVGARLHQAGYEVTLIARGPHLEAIRRAGLTLVTPAERSVLDVPVVAAPDRVTWGDDDVVLLATKSQDTLAALIALREAAGASASVVCLQNGVENERVALRLMESVYGAVVMCPAAHTEPGVVEAYGAELTGMFEIGRYPDGVDHRCREVCAALRRARCHAQPVPDVMRLKYAKLVLNLRNAVEALCRPGEAADELAERARAEGREVLSAAGIAFDAPEVSDVAARWARMGVREIAGRTRAGSSTWQSLARGTGAVETDYLNGEIVLRGRQLGVPTPVNEALCRLAARAAAERLAPRSVAVEDVAAVAV